MRDAEAFAGSLNRARELLPLLVETYNSLNAYAEAHFGQTVTAWPKKLATTG
jgi:hypothetical protein